MTWISLGQFELINIWQFTKSFEGEIFRVKHQLNGDDYSAVRGVIAQGFEDTQVNVFNPKLFSYREESEIFAFYFPIGLSQHSLCFKRLDASKSNWIIDVEVFQSENPQDNLNNYLITRFGEATAMSLVPLLFSGSTTPKSYEQKLVKNKPTKILNENDSRTELRINSTGQPVMLTTGFDETSKPEEVLLRMPPNYYHNEVASSAGIYKGAIYAIAQEETYLYITEFSAK
ncbi:MAG: hypothetical protein ACFB2X_07985 [Rivularia sp. (in: cyanobacteria)]